MALKKSPYALGTKPAPTSCEAAHLVVQRGFFVVGAALAIGDIVEIAVIPPYHYLVGANVYVEGGAALASLGDVKLLTGTPDDPDAGRAQTGPVIITNAKLNDDGRLVKPADNARGIGILMAAAEAAAAGKVIHFDLVYAQG